MGWRGWSVVAGVVGAGGVRLERGGQRRRHAVDWRRRRRRERGHQRGRRRERRESRRVERHGRIVRRCVGAGRRRAGLPRSLRPEHGPDLLHRHRPERMGQRHERVQPGGDPDGVGERLRGPSPGRVPPGERDGQRRDAQAARPVVLGADGDARRQSRQDAVRHLVSPERPERQVPRRREAGVRHAAQRLDLPARSAGARLAAAGRDRRRLRGQRARGDQRQLLRALRRRGEHQQARHRRVLPQQPERRPLEGDLQPETA